MWFQVSGLVVPEYYEKVAGQEVMFKGRRLLTLDSNIFIAALKKNEEHSDKYYEIIRRVLDQFLLTLPLPPAFTFSFLHHFSKTI